MELNDADVQEIIRLLGDSGYDELLLETEQFKLILRRSKSEPGGWTQERQTLTEPTVLKSAKSTVPQKAASGPETERPTRRPLQDGLIEVSAPLVGTFYRAPQPGVPAFVEVGAMVEPDTVIAIIEVMKLMNSIAAGVTGEVVEICCEDAAFVEQGQCLMRVRPLNAPAG